MDERQPAEDLAAMGAPASPDALKEIVARHHRRRSRTLGVLLAVALVAGPLAGWAIGQGGGGGQRVATGSNGGTPTAANAPTPGANGGVSGAAIASPAGPGAKATHLFTRTTSDGITIRAYRMDPPTPPPSTPSTATAKAQTICPKPMPVEPGGTAGTGSGEAGTSSAGPETKPAPPPNTAVNGTPPACAPGAPPICKAAPSVLAEVSSDAAVGQSFDAIDEKQPADALSHVLGTLFGVAENSPALVVTVQTGPGVASVRLRLPDGGTDQMAPSNGTAVLARGSTGLLLEGSVVEALDGGGKVLASQPVNQPGPKMGFACGIMAGPQPAVRAFQAPAPATPPTTR